jgi:hypothetical protein
MTAFTPEQERLFRHALAEFVSRVEPRPALHLIRMRKAPAEANRQGPKTSTEEGTDTR